MVYNRCVARDYSKNCPYSPRFTFLLYEDWKTASLEQMRNPESRCGAAA